MQERLKQAEIPVADCLKECVWYETAFRLELQYLNSQVSYCDIHTVYSSK